MSYEAYVTPEHYLEKYGGSIVPEKELPKVLWQASRHIDSLTYNRIVGRGFSSLTQFQQDIIQDVYMVLIMSVNPGFGGQKFIEHSVEKVRELRALIERTGSKALIEVDGGVNLETGARLVEAGADVLVAGNAVFGAPDPEEMIRQLHKL